MSKIAAYLSEHLKGEVFGGATQRQRFSRDGSILQITPLVVAHPAHANDIRKIIHFAWQLAEKGHVLPVTARGSGSSTTGGTLGSGVVACLESHFINILELDTKQRLVRLQPGVPIRTLNTTTQTHGQWWPVTNHDRKSTVGGAIANGLFSEQANRYGGVENWVDQLEVILSNGDIIQTKRLSKRELSRKRGQNDMEGEIYRQVDNIINDHEEEIAELANRPGCAGYALAKVKQKNTFDLTPLFIGSQGTLGIISEAIVKLSPYRPRTEVIAVSLSSQDELENLLARLDKYKPLRADFVDTSTLRFAREVADIRLPELISEDENNTTPQGLLLIEMLDEGRLGSKAKKAANLFEKAGHTVTRSNDDFETANDMKQAYDRLLVSLNYYQTSDNKTTIPLIEDALIIVSDFTSFTQDAYKLAKKHRVELLLWAHLATGVVHARPLLNLRNLSDKQKAKGLMRDYYALVIKYDGSVAGEYGEGRLRAAVAATQFSQVENDLFTEVKNVFDGHGILNPDVKQTSGEDPFKNLTQ